MIKRLAHGLFGHRFTESRQYTPPPTSCSVWEFEHYRDFVRYGATVILQTCDCGTVKVRKVPGRFDSLALEVQELERLKSL